MMLSSSAILCFVFSLIARWATRSIGNVRPTPLPGYDDDDGKSQNIASNAAVFQMNSVGTSKGLSKS